jgi:putative transcriptional regulator
VPASDGPDDRPDSATGLLGGRLLVAAPALADPNFSRTVVLVLEHDEPGAVGVVLNRPLHVEVSEILEPWAALASKAAPSVVFSGGPVSPDAVIGLASPSRRDAAPGPADPATSTGEKSWRTVTAGVAVVDLSVAPDDQPLSLGAVRLFSGYAGWAPGQLESELEDGGWLVVDAVPGDAFAARPEQLWHDVLQRQGGRTAMLASYPPSPTVN